MNSTQCNVVLVFITYVSGSRRAHSHSSARPFSSSSGPTQTLSADMELNNRIAAYDVSNKIEKMNINSEFEQPNVTRTLMRDGCECQRRILFSHQRFCCAVRCVCCGARIENNSNSITELMLRKLTNRDTKKTKRETHTANAKTKCDCLVCVFQRVFRFRLRLPKPHRKLHVNNYADDNPTVDW